MEMQLNGGRWTAIAAAVFVVLALVAFALENASTQDEREGPYAFVVGDQKLSLPSSYFRPPSDDGAIELAAFFPAFSPAGRFDDIDAHTDLDDRFQRLVFLELRPADAKVDPAERVSRLYLRFLSETAWSHPGGLIARAFEPGSPYEGDELFFTPPDGREFAARCRAGGPERETPNTCIAVVRSGGIDAQVRFSAGLLSEWPKLMEGARGLIETARR